MSALSTQNDALRRRSNFFRGAGRETPPIIAREHARDVNPLEARRTSPVADDAMTERDKLEIIERHITAFAATLPAGSLSDANKQDIRSRAMRGGSSTSAIMTSVMQAVAVVKPTLQPQAANYYSSTAGTEAGLSDLRGIDGRPGSRDYAGAFGTSGMRGGSGNFGRGNYASAGSSSGNMSYVSNPGSVSMINYASTPYAATGMTHSTFSYLRDNLRQEKFSGSNIVHSGQDARTNGFSPNERSVAKAFAVLDRDDGARREARNTQLATFRDKMAKDSEIERLKVLRDKATGEERQKLDEQLIARGLQLSQETGTRKFLDAAPTAAAREQGRVIERKTIEKLTGAQFDYVNKTGLTPDADAKASLSNAKNIVQAKGMVQEVGAKYDSINAAVSAKTNDKRMAASQNAFGLSSPSEAAPTKAADAAASDLPAATNVASALPPATSEPVKKAEAGTPNAKPANDEKSGDKPDGSNATVAGAVTRPPAGQAAPLKTASIAAPKGPTA